MSEYITAELTAIRDIVTDVTNITTNLTDDIARYTADTDHDTTDTDKSLETVDRLMYTLREVTWDIDSTVDMLEDDMSVTAAERDTLLEVSDVMSVPYVAADMRHELRGRVITARTGDDGAIGAHDAADILAWVDAALGILADMTTDPDHIDTHDASVTVTRTLRLAV
jgi:hypothetical protein